MLLRLTGRLGWAGVLDRQDYTERTSRSGRRRMRARTLSATRAALNKWVGLNK